MWTIVKIYVVKMQVHIKIKSIEITVKFKIVWQNICFIIVNNLVNKIFLHTFHNNSNCFLEVF